jgi:hypothetical protein
MEFYRLKGNSMKLVCIEVLEFLFSRFSLRSKLKGIENITHSVFEVHELVTPLLFPQNL